MPYCPVCYTEYQEGIKICADDGAALVEGAPRFCGHCKAFVPEEDVFCPSCGRLQTLPENADPPECENHPDREAEAGCVVCSKPLCDECAQVREDVVYCEDDRHRQIDREFVEVYRTSTDYEAEMLRANLEGSGIDAVVFNQHDHVYFVNMGVLAVVKVMARRKDAVRAREIIDSIMESDEEEENGTEA